MRTNGMIQAYVMHKRVYGERHSQRIEDQTAEECAELITAILQHRRGDAIEKVYEEIADVEICLDMLKQDIGKKGVEHFIHVKTSRLNRRLEEVEAKTYKGTREP